MFAALKNTPDIQTRKALIIINLQNDSLYRTDDFYVTKNPEIVPRLKEMIPYFRKVGDVIWVRTEMALLPSAQSSDTTGVEERSKQLAEKNRKARTKEEAFLLDDTQDDKSGRNQLPTIDDPDDASTLAPYDPSSRTKKIMTRASAETRAESRTTNLQTLADNEDNNFVEQMTKPRKGRKATFYIGGTKGAEICDELLDQVDRTNDLILAKHFYSAFDQTSLLTTLRMNLITEIYLCGCLSNASIYSTAADAVQHGIEVTIVEDCVGYRNEEKHEEAMKMMADVMGVNYIDAAEIIDESGGRAIPDSATPGITLRELSLNADEVLDQGSLAAEGSNPQAGQRPPSLSEVLTQEKTTRRSSKGLGDALTKEATPSRSSPAPTAAGRKRESWMRSKAETVGPDDHVGSGDSRIIYDALSSSLSRKAFDQVKDEVGWQTMSHRGGQVPRMVAVQGELEKDGYEPIYRHPADESPSLKSFTPAIEKIRKEVEESLSQPFNHALIQMYRGGLDNISEHSDKTLDITRGSNVVNVSLGAQRAMTLRTKKSKTTHGTDSPSARLSQRIKLLHNSIIILGPRTNREWLHGVHADKRPNQEKTPDEKLYEGERISITFRQIGTFMNPGKKRIWGSGATQKSKAKAAKIADGDTVQMEAMITAFGKENQQSDFDWDAEYGSGFDVVNLVDSQAQAKLILCKNPVANLRVQLSLGEKSILYTVIEAPSSGDLNKLAIFQSRYVPWTHGLANTESPVLSGIAPERDTIEGDLAILIHLEKTFLPPSGEHHQYTAAQLYSCIAQSNELLYIWYELQHSREREDKSRPTHRFIIEQERPVTPETSLEAELHNTLKGWEDYLGESNYSYIAGDYWSGIDCAFWPVFNSICADEGLDPKTYPNLVKYHQRAMRRQSVKGLTGS